MIFRYWDGKMIGEIIRKIVGKKEPRNNSSRPIRVMQDTANSWRIVYAD